MPSTEDRISIREYARRLSIDEKAVRKAIGAGRIVRGYDTEAKKILPGIANEEWGHKHVVAKPIPGVGRERAIAKLEANPATSGRTASADTADRSEGLPLDNPAAVDLLQSIAIHSNLPVAEAMRLREIIGAAQDKLKLSEAEGRLVEKDRVYKALYAAGSELKKALLNIPVRVCRDIMAATNEVEAINILTDEITAVLTTYGHLQKNAL